MHRTPPENAENPNLLIHHMSGYLVVAEMNAAIAPGKRIFGFFNSQREMKDFLKALPARVIAIKKITQAYYDGEGLNYA
jgi:hypothetical protein